MPVFFQKEISPQTRLAVWQIDEEESFFRQKVSLQASITHPHKRLQHLAGRYLLSYLFPEFPHNEILIADTRKPYLKSDAFHFSISHSSNLAAAIVSKDYRVGIDIETYTDKVLKIRDKFLNVDEFNFIENKEDIHLITSLWSAKESVFKWWSYGGVDFSEDILFSKFRFAAKGTIDALFRKNETERHLEVQYRLFDAFCLTYVLSNGI